MNIEKNYIEKKLFISSNDQVKLRAIKSGIFSDLELSYLNLRLRLLKGTASFYVDSSFNVSIIDSSLSYRKTESQIKYEIQDSISETLNFIKIFDEQLSKGKFYFSKNTTVLNYFLMFIFCSENIDLAKQFFNTIPKKYVAKTIYYFSNFLSVFNQSYTKPFDLKEEVTSIEIKNNIQHPFFDIFVEICQENMKSVSLQEMESLFLRSIYFLKPFFDQSYYSYFESLYGKFADNDKQEILSFISKTLHLNLCIPQPNKFIEFSTSNKSFCLNTKIITSKTKEEKIILPYINSFYSILFKSILNNFEKFKNEYQFNLKYLAFRAVGIKSNSISSDVFLNKFSFSIFLYFVEKYNSFCFYENNKYAFLNFDKNKINFDNLNKISQDYKTYFLIFYTESNQPDMIDYIADTFKYTEDLFFEYSYLFKKVNLESFKLFSYLYKNNKILELTEFEEKKQSLYYSSQNYIDKSKTHIKPNQLKTLLEQYKLKEELEKF